MENGAIEFLDLERSAFEKDSFLELIDGTDANFYKKLNREQNLQGAPQPKTANEAFQQLFRRTKVDTIIFEDPKTGRWVFYARAEDNKAKRLFMVKPPSDKSESGLKSWLIDKIGYSGFVVAKKGKYVLVASLGKIDTKANALYIGNSESSYRVTGGRAKFGGLLRYVNSHGNASVFLKLSLEAISPSKKPVKLCSKINSIQNFRNRS